MKPRWLVMGSAAALVLAAAAAYGSFATAQPYGSGWGMMGRGFGPGMMQGYGPGGGYGPGMMGGWAHGYGPQNCPWLRDGTAGLGYERQGNLNLSTDDVKARFERWITLQGNPRLKVGEIKEKDGDTITVDIVTKDNSLVEQFLIDRHTGVSRPSGG